MTLYKLFSGPFQRPTPSRLKRGRGTNRLGLAILLICGISFGTLSASSGEPVEMPAYREMIRGDQLRDDGRTRHALARYREAIQQFEALQRDYPDYKPATIEYRLAYCREQIRLLEEGTEAPPRDTPDIDSAEAAREEAAHWRSETERLRHRVEELEARVPAPESDSDGARIQELEAELAQARERIRQWESYIEFTEAPPTVRTADPPDPEAPAPVPAPPTPEDQPETQAGEKPTLTDAEQALANGDWVSALRLFEELLEADPDVKVRGFLPWRRRSVGGDPRVRFGLARAQAQLGRLRDAAQTAAGLAREYPEEAAYTHLSGWIAQLRNRDSAAVRFYAKAVETDPDNAEYRFDYAAALHVTQQYGDAAQHYQEVLRIQPDHGLAHFNLAAIRVMEDPRHLDEARAHYSRALELGETPDPRIERHLQFLSEIQQAQP